MQLERGFGHSLKLSYIYIHKGEIKFSEKIPKNILCE